MIKTKNISEMLTSLIEEYRFNKILFKKIARDLYCYYGVSEEDIKNRTKRYSSLVTELSS